MGLASGNQYKAQSAKYNAEIYIQSKIALPIFIHYSGLNMHQNEIQEFSFNF